MTSKRETGHENQRRGITATVSGAMVSHMLVWTNGLRNCWSDTALLYHPAKVVTLSNDSGTQYDMQVSEVADERSG